MSDSIANLQDEGYYRVVADAGLAQVAVINQRKGDILNDVVSSLGTFNERGSKVGACIIVLAPTAKLDPGLIGVPGAPLTIGLTFRVLEDPVVNQSATGTLMSATAIVRRLFDLLAGFRPHGFGQPFRPLPSCIIPVDDPLAPVAFEVRFETDEADSELYLKVSQPVASPKEGAAPQTVTLTCSTSGAAIYYTTDGSHPYAGNVNSSLYSVPFSVTNARSIRACAFKAGWIASDVVRAVFT